MSKKLLSLLLAAALACALCAPAAAAELPFTDSDRIAYPAECAILVQLGVISGLPDGSFSPDQPLTGAQAASLVARLGDLGAPAAAVCGLPASHWAAASLNACLQAGIIEQGGFNPERAITLAEFARMLLRLIGYQATDASWQQDAEQAGLFAGYSGAQDRFLTRELACLLSYNALGSLAIAGWQDGQPIYYTDDLLNPLTLLEARFGLHRYTEVIVANDKASLTGEPLEEGYTQLAEHRAFQVTTDFDAIGRTAEIFLKDGEVVGQPRYSVTENRAVLGSTQQLQELMQVSGFKTDGETKYYVNFEPATARCLTDSYDRCEITVLDYERDGVFDLVLVSAWQVVTITELEPLFVNIGGGVSRLLQGAEAPASAEPGDEIAIRQIADVWYINE